VDAPPNLVITITDVSRAGFCPRGAKRWFEAHDLDFRAFLKDGISAADVIGIGDAFAERVIAKKLGR
jgi:hypothetical protein